MGHVLQNELDKIAGRNVYESDLEWLRVYDRHRIVDDVTSRHFISHYANINNHEMFAESFSLYKNAPERLPADVKDYFNRIANARKMRALNDQSDKRPAAVHIDDFINGRSYVVIDGVITENVSPKRLRDGAAERVADKVKRE